MEPTGSARISSVAGDALAKQRDRPVMVPELPQPNTMAPSLPPTWRRRGEARGPAGQGARAAAAEHDGVELAAHLAQDFRAGTELVRGRIVRVPELVDEVRAGGLARDALGHVLVVVRVALGHVRAGEHDLRAHRLEVEDLFPAHLVRDHQDQLVALLLRHQGKADAGVAGGAFDQGVAGPDVTALLRGLDHAQADAVLDRAAGVLAF